MKLANITLKMMTLVIAVAGAIVTLHANRVSIFGRIWTVSTVTGLETCITILTPCVPGFLVLCKTIDDRGYIAKTVFTIGSRCLVPFKTYVH